jgi:HEAT repeat protein
VTLGVALLAVALALAAIGFFALRKLRRPVRAGGADWAGAAGHEFADLPESARCDLVFAVAALGDQRAQDILERALGDPSEPVALAAAHALIRRGSGANVERYLAANPGARATHLSALLSLLAAE